jgi:transcriptional regulator with XRE-family HTH domain
MVNIGKVISMGKGRKPRDRSEFAARMHAAREQAGLTQEQVRGKLGISQSTLSEAEGPSSAGSSYVVHFAKLYGVRPEWLAMGEGDMRSSEAVLPPEAMVGADLALSLATRFAKLPEVHPGDGSLKRGLYNALMGEIDRWEREGAPHEEAGSEPPAPSPTEAPPPGPKMRTARGRAG